MQDQIKISLLNLKTVSRRMILRKRKTVKEYTRQTFLIDKEQLNKLKDFVHTKRLKVDYSYTQKRAVSEALELLFASVDEIEKKRY